MPIQDPMAENSFTSPAPTARNKNNTNIIPKPLTVPNKLNDNPFQLFITPWPSHAIIVTDIVNLLGIFHERISVVNASTSSKPHSHTDHIILHHPFLF